MLEFKNVSKSFQEKKILTDVSFSLEKGEVLGVIGPSGCGKTTLYNLACGILAPDSGIITRNYKKASFVFQEDRLLPWRTAKENITVFGASEKSALDYLIKTGLYNEKDFYPDELSGGMKRRLCLARALACGGDIFFLDEAFNGLDQKTKKDMLILLKDELKNSCALIITHDKTVADFLFSKTLAF